MTPSEVAAHRASYISKIREHLQLDEDTPYDEVIQQLQDMFTEEEIRQMLVEACTRKRGEVHDDD